MTTKKIDVFLNLPAPVLDVPVTLSVKKSDIITGDEILNMINDINATLKNASDANIIKKINSNQPVK